MGATETIGQALLNGLDKACDLVFGPDPFPLSYQTDWTNLQGETNSQEFPLLLPEEQRELHKQMEVSGHGFFEPPSPKPLRQCGWQPKTGYDFDVALLGPELVAWTDAIHFRIAGYDRDLLRMVAEAEQAVGFRPGPVTREAMRQGIVPPRPF